LVAVTKSQAELGCRSSAEEREFDLKISRETQKKNPL